MPNVRFFKFLTCCSDQSLTGDFQLRPCWASNCMALGKWSWRDWLDCRWLLRTRLVFGSNGGNQGDVSCDVIDRQERHTLNLNISLEMGQQLFKIGQKAVERWPVEWLFIPAWCHHGISVNGIWVGHESLGAFVYINFAFEASIVIFAKPPLPNEFVCFLITRLLWIVLPSPLTHNDMGYQETEADDGVLMGSVAKLGIISSTCNENWDTHAAYITLSGINKSWSATVRTSTGISPRSLFQWPLAEVRFFIFLPARWGCPSNSWQDS